LRQECARKYDQKLNRDIVEMNLLNIINIKEDLEYKVKTRTFVRKLVSSDKLTDQRGKAKAAAKNQDI